MVDDECWDAVRDAFLLDAPLRRVYTYFGNMEGFGREMVAVFDQKLVDLLRSTLMSLGMKAGEVETWRQHYMCQCAERQRKPRREPR